MCRIERSASTTCEYGRDASTLKIKFDDLCTVKSATLRCRTPSYFQPGYALNSALRQDLVSRVFPCSRPQTVTFLVAAPTQRIFLCDDSPDTYWCCRRENTFTSFHSFILMRLTSKICSSAVQWLQIFLPVKMQRRITDLFCLL